MKGANHAAMRFRLVVRLVVSAESLAILQAVVGFGEQSAWREK